MKTAKGKPKINTFLVRMDNSTHELLRRVAYETKLSMTEIAVLAIKKYLQKYEKAIDEKE